MTCDLRAKRATRQMRRRVLFAALVAMALAAGYAASVAGQPIQLVLDGTIDFLESNPNYEPGLTNEELGLQEGDPIRFTVEFDPASPTETVDRLLVQLDGTTFTLENLVGTHFLPDSSPFRFWLITLDSLQGALNGLDLYFDPASTARTVFVLAASEDSTAAGFPVDLTFEDLTYIQSGHFWLSTEPWGGRDESNIFTVDFADLNIHVIPEPGVAGDFNEDGNVDAADYVVWRKNDGGANALANDDDLGTPIRAEHYNLWRAHFGEIEMPDIAAGGQIPEPGSFVLAAAGLALAAASSTARRYRRCAACFALWAKNAGEQAFRGLRRRG